MNPILEIRDATKTYFGVPAIKDVSFSLMPGEVHALVGENGAGKSTLTKIMAGVVELNSGEMLVDGKAVRPRTPLEALSMGIAMVFQETSLIPSMTVAQNLYLGQEKVINRLRGIYIAAQQSLQSLNFNVDPTELVANLGAAQKQMVEITRAVLHGARIIVFDEPTATLTPEEKQHFFNLVNDLKKRDVSIIFISHALEEALELSDRITVLRDGQKVVTDDTANFDRDRIVRSMVGHELSDALYGTKQSMRSAGKRVLSVQNLRMGAMVRGASFSVFAGQITGVFGLVGAGRSETFKVVAGVVKRNHRFGGRVVLNDKAVRFRVPAKGVAAGIAYVTEDRKVDGFFETMNIRQNIYTGLLAKLRRRRPIIRPGEQNDVGEKWTQALNIKAVTKNASVIELSGGNQQKVVIGRSMVQEPELIIFDEPTRGVDVGAVAEIHQFLNELADQGKAVVIITSYLPEVLSVADRILVARQGKIVEEFENKGISEEDIMYASIH